MNLIVFREKKGIKIWLFRKWKNSFISILLIGPLVQLEIILDTDSLPIIWNFNKDVVYVFTHIIKKCVFPPTSLKNVEQGNSQVWILGHINSELNELLDSVIHQPTHRYPHSPTCPHFIRILLNVFLISTFSASTTFLWATSLTTIPKKEMRWI